MKASKHVLAIAMGLALFGTAHAEDWKVTGQFGNFGVGKASELEKGHLYWVGEFGGVFFNDKGKDSLFDHAGVKCPAFNDLDLNNKKGKAGGYCIISDATGDQAYLTWKCEGDTVVCSGPFEYKGWHREIPEYQRRKYLFGHHCCAMEGRDGFRLCHLESVRPFESNLNSQRTKEGFRETGDFFGFSSS